MGIGVVLHGYIECYGYAGFPETRRVHRANRRVLRHLPVSDSEWPFITKDMFSMLSLRTSLKRCHAQYEHDVIYFAGDYKNMYVIEADWIQKFERILSNLCWHRAVVDIEFCAYRYEWEVPLDHIGERYRKNPPQPPTEWTFRCYERELKPVPSSHAIDGSFTSRFHVKSEDAI